MNRALQLRQIFLSNLSISYPSSYAFNQPIYIFLEVTNRCNLACTMCGRTHDPRYNIEGHCGDLTLDRVKKLDAIFPYAEYVIPTGVGEPFMNRELIPIIHYLKQKNTQVSITSNGTILSPKYAAEIVDAGLDKIVFSVDAATRETYEKFRINASFEAVINNIKRLSQYKAEKHSNLPIIELELVAMLDNFRELPAWAELAVQMKCQGLIVQKMLSHTGSPQELIHNQQNLNHIPYSQGKAIWENFLSIVQKNGLYLASPFSGLDLSSVFGPDVEGTVAAPIQEEQPLARQADSRMESKPSEPEKQQAAGSGQVPDATAAKPLRPMYCTQPWSIIYVTWKGEVRTCCFNEYCLGKLEDSSFPQIWNGPQYREMRRAVRKGRVLDICRDCVQANLNYSVIKDWKMTAKQMLSKKI